MNDIPRTVVDVISAFMSVYCFYLFYGAVARKKHNRIIRLLYLFAIAFVFSLSIIFIENKIIHATIVILLTVTTALIFQMKWYNYILMPLLIYVILTLTELLVAGVVSTLFSINLETGRQGVYYYLGLFLSKFIAYIFVMLFRFRKHKTLFGTFKSGAAFLILLPVATVSVILLQYNFFLQIPSDAQNITVASICCYSLLFLSNILVFAMIDRIYDDSVKDARLNVATEVISKQELQYKQLVVYHNDIQKIRHDQKNYLIGVIGELHNGNIKNALLSLEKEYNTISNETIQYSSESSIVHLIISNKKAVADNKNIGIDFSYRNLSRINISSIDLAIILGNILDNAIEATEKVTTAKRTIKVFTAVQNDVIIIRVENPTADKVDIFNLSSTKEESSKHGFGIISIRNIASKHNGNVEFDYKDHIFYTVVYLNNE